MTAYLPSRVASRIRRVQQQRERWLAARQSEAFLRDLAEIQREADRARQQQHIRDAGQSIGASLRQMLERIQHQIPPATGNLEERR